VLPATGPLAFPARIRRRFPGVFRVVLRSWRLAPWSVISTMDLWLPRCPLWPGPNATHLNLIKAATLPALRWWVGTGRPPSASEQKPGFCCLLPSWRVASGRTVAPAGLTLRDTSAHPRQGHGDAGVKAPNRCANRSWYLTVAVPAVKYHDLNPSPKTNGQTPSACPTLRAMPGGGLRPCSRPG
jgi:hypothetical protein